MRTNGAHRPCITVAPPHRTLGPLQDGTEGSTTFPVQNLERRLSQLENQLQMFSHKQTSGGEVVGVTGLDVQVRSYNERPISSAATSTEIKAANAVEATPLVSVLATPYWDASTLRLLSPPRFIAHARKKGLLSTQNTRIFWSKNIVAMIFLGKEKKTRADKSCWGRKRVRICMLSSELFTLSSYVAVEHSCCCTRH